MGVPIASRAVTGCASANRDRLQIFADVHGCPVQPFQTTAAAALGAALRAAHGYEKATGPGRSWSEVVAPFTSPAADLRVDPDEANRAVYDHLLETYRALESNNL